MKCANEARPPFARAQTHGPQWVGVPQSTLRIFTIMANKKNTR